MSDMTTDFNPTMLLEDLERMQRNIRREIRASKKGSLLVTKTKCGPAFFLVSKDADGIRRRKGIGRRPDIIYNLAHREYLERKLKLVCADIVCLKHLIIKYEDVSPEGVLSGMPEKFNVLNKQYIITPDLLGGDASCPNPVSDAEPRVLRLTTGNLSPAEWGSVPYSENTKFKETKVHFTEKGVATRSKNEAIILGLYDKAQIPYHYDERVLIGGDWRSPDIIAARPDGTLFIHEHCGLSTPDYAANLEAKLKEYRSCGFEQGRNLLLTFDDPINGIDIRLIKMQIENMYRRREYPSGVL